MTDTVTRRHRGAAAMAMGIEGWSIEGVALAIAQAEQRGAERERTAVKAWLDAEGELELSDGIEHGLHLENSDD
jgi:hypothetical protein